MSTPAPDELVERAGSRNDGAGLLIVLSGPSGVGKDTVIEALLPRVPGLNRVVTATTRPPRQDEIPGVSYHFLDRATFEQWRDQDQFVESTEFANQHDYGTPRASLMAALADGSDALLKIEVDGALQVRKRLPGAILIFLAPPSLEELERRLRGEDAHQAETRPERDQIQARIDRAREEMARRDAYDYCVVNHTGSIERAVDQTAAIIVAERLRVHPRRVKL